MRIRGDRMIEHVFIKNYKAFTKENIPIGKNTLLLGTNKTGKTTVFQALDLFFNHQLNQRYILNNTKDVVVEIHINEQRYRKTFSPPTYKLNFDKCIGDMFSINHLQYLYIPSSIDIPTLLNQILTINLTEKLSNEELQRIVKVSDYLDGVLGNSNYPIFKISRSIEMAIPSSVSYSKQELLNIISNITYQYLILGIDQVEDNFDIEQLSELQKFTYQTIYSTKQRKVVTNKDYTITHLYKGNQKEDYESIKNRIQEQEQTYLLVEGKYDVNWFETALKLLNKTNLYTVIPCGGSGNIRFVKEQLEKEGFQTIVITDGDTKKDTSLKRDVIEQYASLSYINERFKTDFKRMPKDKYHFFKQFTVKDDVVKNVLSRWAKKHLAVDSEFVQEVSKIIA